MQISSVEAILENKVAAKKQLSEILKKNLKNQLLMAVILDQNTDDESINKIVNLAEGAASVNVNVVVLVDDVKTDSHNCFLQYNKKNRLMLLEAADVALTFSFTDVEELALNGVIPIGVDGVEDYNPNKETGTGFSYENKDVWTMFAALIRAKETFRFPYDWKHLLRNSLTKLKKNSLV